MPNALGEHRKDASTKDRDKNVLRRVRTMRYNVLANLSVLVCMTIAHWGAIVKNYF